MNVIMKQFRVQPYTKKELALLYFPDSTPRTAVSHLKAWIYHCEPLVRQLRLLDYRPSSKCFTPLQVKAITDHLGEP